jgi:hypothetical protein
MKSLTPYSTSNYFLGGFSPLGDIIIGRQCKSYKGFFWEKIANCNHIWKEKEKLNLPYLDNKFQHVQNIARILNSTSVLSDL